MKRIYLSFLAFLFVGSAFAQLSFTNQTQLLQEQGFHSGVAIAVTDLNEDGLDDIARLQQGRQLYLEIQQPDGSFVGEYIANMASSSEWSMCVADVDNDGFNDVFSGGAYNGMTLVNFSADGSSFISSDLPGSDNIFLQGSNFADINNDGNLDIFGCHDDGESRIWQGDGAGNFTPADNWIDMATTPSSDNSGNYGSVWCDFDYDGDLDLYIAKCRQGVNSPSDPRRINALFVNDGNGNFTEQADLHGLKIGAQTWTADFADYDNDGDFDAFLTNHDVPSQLLRNDNGMFVDVTASAGVNVTVYPIQGIMKDFDNDGFVDILVAGGDEQFFHNDGDGTFTEITGLFDGEDMESFAIGDLNHDGFLDIYGGYASVFTSPTNVDDALWMNNANGNNYIAVDLQGVVSNRSAIGAKVEIYGDWGVQVREIRAGECYGIVNTTTAHFGIGTATEIDQIIVKWPSGIVDVVNDPSPNQFITIIENNCVSPDLTITPMGGDNSICPGESLTLNATSGLSSYSWNNGSTSSSITVTSGGTYSLVGADANGCPANAAITIIEIVDEPATISAAGELEFCEGESVTLNANGGGSGYQWSNGDSGASITVSNAGSYTVNSQGECGEVTSEAIEVSVLAAPSPVSGGDQTIPSAQSVTLTATGNDLTWYDAPNAGNVVASGGSFDTPVISTTTSYYVEDKYLYGGAGFNSGLENHSGPDYSGSQYNGALQFNALQDFTLNSVKIYTDFPGQRIIELRNANGDVLESMTINPAATGNAEIITLDFFIPAGNGYELGTNEANNNSQFGDSSPEMKRNNEGVNYPYEVTDVLSIYDSNIGSDFYYYFYDWDISLPSQECISDRTEVTVFVQGVSVNDINDSDKFKMYPNPTSGDVFLEMDLTEQAEINVEISDVAGKLVRSYNWGTLVGMSTKSIDLNDMLPGMYTVRLTANDEVYSTKLVIQ